MEEWIVLGAILAGFVVFVILVFANSKQRGM